MNVLGNYLSIGIYKGKKFSAWCRHDRMVVGFTITCVIGGFHN